MKQWSNAKVDRKKKSYERGLKRIFENQYYGHTHKY